MNNRITVLITWCESNYGAYSPMVDGCVAVDDTIEGVIDGYTSALKGHIKYSEPDELPSCLLEPYELDFELDTSALLKHYSGVVSIKVISRETGINERQLGHYISGFRKPKADKRERIVQGLRAIGK